MVMRSVWPCFFRRDLLTGPFFLCLTDLHQSNTFVDKDWNITSIIDLEWACSLPVEMMHPPSWLSNQHGGSIDPGVYGSLHKEFIDLPREKEQTCSKERQSSVRLHSILHQGWENGTFWCSPALSAPAVLFGIFYNHIQPRFSEAHKDDEELEEEIWSIKMQYWGFNAFDLIMRKVEEEEKYDKCLQEEFLGLDGK
ncbi:hypothetical protein N7478_011428 [Penicillium angulare]|uniref:uncharacterized protein n=1 Tax=Penicillium angulare TaxID=116970 RepID=UPI00253FD5DC|nr:uncharacterized protein N7478_011428 [Penicillium angulare]KAJ5263823.1 hypothetical protein N7478_011428 [Penicillium angulare]